MRVKLRRVNEATPPRRAGRRARTIALIFVASAAFLAYAWLLFWHASFSAGVRTGTAAWHDGAFRSSRPASSHRPRRPGCRLELRTLRREPVRGSDQRLPDVSRGARTRPLAPLLHRWSGGPRSVPGLR